MQAVKAAGSSVDCLKAQTADVEISGPIGNEPAGFYDSGVDSGDASGASSTDDEEEVPSFGDLMYDLTDKHIYEVGLTFSAVVTHTVLFWWI